MITSQRPWRVGREVLDIRVASRPLRSDESPLLSAQYTKTLILPADDAYYPWESRFLADPGTHPRFMRAAKWKMDDAKRRIKATVEWRREYKPELIQPGDVGVEAETGKM